MRNLFNNISISSNKLILLLLDFKINLLSNLNKSNDVSDLSCCDKYSFLIKISNNKLLLSWGNSSGFNDISLISGNISKSLLWILLLLHHKHYCSDSSLIFHNYNMSNHS